MASRSSCSCCCFLSPDENKAFVNPQLGMYWLTSALILILLLRISIYNVNSLFSICYRQVFLMLALFGLYHGLAFLLLMLLLFESEQE